MLRFQGFNRPSERFPPATFAGRGVFAVALGHSEIKRDGNKESVFFYPLQFFSHLRWLSA
jgi:hypothetical protein